MSDNPRIDDLRRRIQKDPASIAFAQLAEELRRAGQCEDAVAVSRTGLAVHPGYLSARVTLGRTLLELNQLSEAQTELQTVLKSAPENLAAIRGLAEIHHRRGEKSEALEQYRAALALARNDPDLERAVSEMAQGTEPQQPALVADGTPIEQVQTAVVKNAPRPAFPPALVDPLPVVSSVVVDDGVKAKALRQIAALEQWLDAIHVVRTQRSA